MAKINIENNDAPKVGVPPIKQLRVVVQVLEREYKISKKEQHYISLKLEILSPETTAAKTKNGIEHFSIAGATFFSTLMLEGKMQKTTRETCDKLGINFEDLCEDTENNEALNVFNGLKFVALIDATARVKQETDHVTGELREALDSEGNKITSGVDISLAPWDIIGLA